MDCDRWCCIATIMILRLLVTPMLFLSASGAVAADLLPLTRGIYVREGTPCRGASNANVVSYWGEDNGLNVSRTACRIDRMTRSGSAYALHRTCREITSGGQFTDRVNLTILGRTSFIFQGRPQFAPEDETYLYCGPRRVP